jgi:hypothetical protein
MDKEVMINYYMDLIARKYPRGVEPEVFFTVPCKEDAGKDYVTAVGYSLERKKYYCTTLYKK